GQKIIPAFLFYKGNYALVMQKGNDKTYLRFLVRKNSYLHYHFEAPDKVEFYKYTRGFFYGGKMKVVAPISKTAEKSKTGSRKLYLPKLRNEKTVIIFNRMPDYVSDSVKKEGLGNGDYICNTEIQLYEVEHLIKSNISFDAK
ncbi:MAG: hypothetical protein IKU45_00205, partial [Clostridia bacterium]|nr:hypothetical protein [Clostridia bacterium]